MTSKQDQILSCVLDVKKDIGEINGHLKALNGSVDRNIKDIDRNRQEIKEYDNRLDLVEKKYAYLFGAITVIFIIAQLVIKFIL